jgi:hypothetical protein
MKTVFGIAMLIWVYYNTKYIEKEDISIATAVKEGMSIIICLLTAILAIMIQKMMQNRQGVIIMAAGVHPLNKEKFYEAINLYISGQASQVKAAKVAGCSVPTFKKYANKIYGGEELPDNLWGKNDD